MHHFHYHNGWLHAEDKSLREIAEAVGTPVYVYSQATLERHFRVFAEALAPLDPLIAFAVKANGAIGVLRVLARLGAGADVVSAGEIERALAAGVPPERIVFSGVGKTEAELAYALAQRVSQINVESPAELALLEQVAAAAGSPAPVALRINPDVGAGANAKITTGAAASKFGVALADAPALYASAAASPHLRPVGLAVHIGSQIENLAPLERAFALLRNLAESLRGQGLPLERLDLGGGLGVPYAPGSAPPSPQAYAQAVLRSFQGFPARFVFEPGRLIAANAGVLLCRVVRVQERPDRRILVLDAGMNDLLRPSLYGARHALWPLREGAGMHRADLVGPVCETGDTFASDDQAPDLSAGELACFMSAGAYGASMSSAYNARALIPEVLVSGAQFALIRRRIETRDLLAFEAAPAWLTDA